MAKKTKNTVRLGIFVTLGTVLFVMAVYYIGSRQALFGKVYHVNTLISNAHGLKVGNNVRYTGITVGSVEDIVFQNDSTLKVDMVLDEQVRGFIKKDAIASIGTEGLVGNVVVNITPGKGNSLPVEDGDFIASYTRTDPNELLNTLGNTNESIALLSLNLLEITEKINKGQGTLSRLIGDERMANDIALSISNLQKMSDNLNRISGQLQPSIDSINNGSGLLGYLIHDNTLPVQMESFVARLDSLTTEETKPLLANLESASGDMALAANELRVALETLNQGDGAATTILKDEAAADNIKETLKNLNEGTARFNENMEALKHNFLFRRYFKKQEKRKGTSEKNGN